MEFNAGLSAYLLGYAGLSALISNRLYPDDLPQNPNYPSITYTQVGEEEVETLYTPDQNMIGRVIQFDVVSSTRESVQAVTKQLRLAFKNYAGTMGGVGGVDVSGVEKLSLIESLEKNKDGGIICYRATIDYQIWYQE